MKKKTTLWACSLMAGLLVLSSPHDATAEVPDKDAVLWSIENGRMDVFKMLMDQGQVDVELSEAIFWTIEKGRIDMFQMLMDEGKVDVNLTRESRRGNQYTQETLLGLATRLNNKDAFSLLVNAGADVNLSTEFGANPLIWAAFNGQPDIAKTLLESGSEVNTIARSNRSSSSVMNALVDGFFYNRDRSEDYLETARLLLASGAEINSSGGFYRLTPLATAVERGHLGLIPILAGEASVDQLGEALYRSLLRTASVAMVQDLIEAGADVNYSFGTIKRTPLMAAFKYEFGREGILSDKRAEAIGLLLSAGADVNIQSSDGRTVLMEAAENGDVESVEFLLSEADANKELIDSKGRTAAQLALSAFREARRGSEMRARLRTISNLLR